MEPGTPGSAAYTASACAVMSSSDVMGCALAQMAFALLLVAQNGREDPEKVGGKGERGARLRGRVARCTNQSYTTTPYASANATLCMPLLLHVYSTVELRMPQVGVHFGRQVAAPGEQGAGGGGGGGAGGGGPQGPSAAPHAAGWRHTTL